MAGADDEPDDFPVDAAGAGDEDDFEPAEPGEPAEPDCPFITFAPPPAPRLPPPPPPPPEPGRIGPLRLVFAFFGLGAAPPPPRFTWPEAATLMAVLMPAASTAE